VERYSDPRIADIIFALGVQLTVGYGDKHEPIKRPYRRDYNCTFAPSEG